MPPDARSRAVALAAAFVVLVAGPRLAFAVVSDAATDICPANADPCQITQTYQVADGATLDFGTRAVAISGSGKLDAGTGSFTLNCGRFDLSTGTAVALNLKGQGPLGTQGGVVTVKVQRR